MREVALKRQCERLRQSGDHEVIGTGRLANAAVPKGVRECRRFGSLCKWGLPSRS